MDWTISLSVCGLAGLGLSTRFPRVGWSITIAAQPLWFAFGISIGDPQFMITSPIYMTFFGVHLYKEIRRKRGSKLGSEPGQRVG